MKSAKLPYRIKAFGLALISTVLLQRECALGAEPPSWWSEFDVLRAEAPADDFAVLNIGQLKHLARSARDAMQRRLPGGAGASANQLVQRWLSPAGPGVVRDDYAAATLGQLKAVASCFHDRLIQTSLSESRPWSTSVADDDSSALANIGQAKHLFCFSLSGVTVDADGDGMIDIWEVEHGLIVGQDESASDSDGDGLTALEEYHLDTKPQSLSSASEALRLRILRP